MERRAKRQTGERQRLVSVQSGGGRSTKLAACGRAAEGNRGDLDGLMGIQMRLNSHQNNPANPLNPQPLGEEGTLSYPQIGREQFQPLEDLILRTCSGHDFRKPLNGHRQCADATSWLVTQPASFLKIRFTSRGAAAPAGSLQEAAVIAPSRSGSKKKTKNRVSEV